MAERGENLTGNMGIRCSGGPSLRNFLKKGNTGEMLSKYLVFSDPVLKVDIDLFLCILGIHPILVYLEDIKN